jgi:transcriptional regulator with PAS, ATPase and Fis domain
MDDLRADIQRTAPTDLTVMIRGERGTGKELVAREIHLKSNRSSGPFVHMNCASLPETLVETELFGCEKGAYTGAVFRKGRFELAHCGTLFLDEIGELSLTAQPKLLRVLETHEVDRVGSQRPVPTDFRLIVATNRNLEEMARAQKFREDLYDRLNMDSIVTPPLRERLDDIPVLAEYFIGAFTAQARRMVRGVTQQVLDLFLQYSWPGNIREFENVIRRAVYTGRAEFIRFEDLGYHFIQKATAEAPAVGNYRDVMRDTSRQLILNALTKTGDDRTKAAKLLGVSRAQLYRLLRTHGLNGHGAETDSEAEESEWLQ